MSKDKPPLGARPEWVYEEKRIIELMDAIRARLDTDYLNDGDISSIKKWSHELTRRLDNFTKLINFADRASTVPVKIAEHITER